MTHTLEDLVRRIDAAEDVRRRAVQDAISMATARYWRRRAAAFEAAVPIPEDFTGLATDEDLADRAERCHATALACRYHAAAIEAGWW